MDRIHETYNEYSGYDWCYTNTNAMVVSAALLYGGGDFAKTICTAVQAAFDTDCNGATAGSLTGVMLGKLAIPEYWYAVFHSELESSIIGYPRMTVEELTERTLVLIDQNSPNERT